MITIAVSGCDIAPGSTMSISQYEVDPRFREFYGLLGGIEILGPAISPKFNHEGYEYQYTAAVLLAYFPTAVEVQRYQLAPLGLELGIAEPPMNPDSPGGHEIYPGFMDVYTSMGRARFVGLPITEVRYNPEKKRIEQFFENVGFYHLETDPENVRLLQYGTWKCADQCGYSPPDEATVVLWSSVEASFDAAIRRLDRSFTGYPLTEAYIAFDGVFEQIFENVVVTANPNMPGNISLRPILGMIGIPGGNNRHFDVPDIFLEVINRNSGLEFSGQPVNEYAALSQVIYRQCFTNLCLEYYPNAPEGLRIRPAPLGYTYKRMFYQSNGGEDKAQPLEISVRVWETYPLLPTNQQQEIGVKLDSGGVSLANFEPVLTLIVPGYGEINYTFPPTNQGGTSYLKLNPVDAPNGTLIEYQVCVSDLRDQRYCVKDDFMLWAE
jgi:hypothetical protein